MDIFPAPAIPTHTHPSNPYSPTKTPQENPKNHIHHTQSRTKTNQTAIK